MKLKLMAGTVALALFGCNGGSSSDPETNDLGEFNPPGQLASLTRDKALELTWIGGNAEDDFQGYQVFGTTTSLADLQKKVAYPKDASILNAQSIPRCKDNNAFFKEFGFPDTDTACESSVIPDDDNDGFFLNGGNMGYIVAEDDKAADEEEKLKIDFNVPCTGEGQKVEDGSVSLSPAADGRTLGRAFCLVNEAYDGKKLASISNGSTYTYLVVAVKGSDKNEISWISNVIADTPAKELFNAKIDLNGGNENNAQYAIFEIDGDNLAETKKPTAKTCSNEPGVCQLTNTATSATEGIVVARESLDTGFKFQQRLVVSSKTGGKVKLQQRGAQIFANPRYKDGGDEPIYLPQVPGDEATDSYATAGTKFTFFEGAVFDFQYDLGNSTFRYGKLVVTDITYKDDKTKSSKVTLDVTIVIQPQVDQVHYFNSAE